MFASPPLDVSFGLVACSSNAVTSETSSSAEGLLSAAALPTPVPVRVIAVVADGEVPRLSELLVDSMFDAARAATYTGTRRVVPLLGVSSTRPDSSLSQWRGAPVWVSAMVGSCVWVMAAALAVRVTVTLPTWPAPTVIEPGETAKLTPGVSLEGA